MSLTSLVTKSQPRMSNCYLSKWWPFVSFHSHRMPKSSEFLGMDNFYHIFVPHAAALMAPLHGMSHAKGQEFQWTTQLHWCNEGDLDLCNCIRPPRCYCHHLPHCQLTHLIWQFFQLPQLVALSGNDDMITKMVNQ